MNKGVLSKLPPPPSGKTGWPWTIETNADQFETNRDYSKISIVMPTYNQGLFIEESIRSLLLQNYPNLEFFIFDGGSNDETIEIIKKYEPWISYWVSAKDGGQSNAINMGIKRCTGEWFNWLNSDDYLLEDALFYFEKKINELKEKPIAICGSKLVMTIKGQVLELPPNTKNRFYEDFIGMGYFQAAALYNMDAIRIVGGVDENLHFTMDIKLVMQLNLLGDTERIDKHVMVARTHEASKGAQSIRFHDEWIKAYAFLINYIPKEHRNNALSDKLEKVTGISFKMSASDISIISRFKPEEYKYAQLYMGERIINLMYGNNKTGVRELIKFYQSNYPEYYRNTNLSFIKFKSNPLIKIIVKAKNLLLKN